MWESIARVCNLFCALGFLVNIGYTTPELAEYERQFKLDAVKYDAPWPERTVTTALVLPLPWDAAGTCYTLPGITMIFINSRVPQNRKLTMYHELVHCAYYTGNVHVDYDSIMYSNTSWDSYIARHEEYYIEQLFTKDIYELGVPHQ